MEKLTLTFRRGGDWNFEKGAAYFYRFIGSGSDPEILWNASGGPSNERFEYAGPFDFEEVEPEPEPLRIEGYQAPIVYSTHGMWVIGAQLKRAAYFMSVPGSTRREAIERFNLLAKVMGAKG